MRFLFNVHSWIPDQVRNDGRGRRRGRVAKGHSSIWLSAPRKPIIPVSKRLVYLSRRGRAPWAALIIDKYSRFIKMPGAMVPGVFWCALRTTSFRTNCLRKQTIFCLCVFRRKTLGSGIQEKLRTARCWISLPNMADKWPWHPALAGMTNVIYSSRCFYSGSLRKFFKNWLKFLRNQT